MRLKVQATDSGHQNSASVGVCWLNNDSLLSVGDDRQLLQWSVVGRQDAQPMQNYKKSVFYTELFGNRRKMGLFVELVYECLVSNFGIFRAANKRLRRVQESFSRLNSYL